MLSKPKSGKAHEKKKSNGLVRILAFAALVVMTVYVGFSIISNNIQIRNNKQQLKELTEQTNAMKARNEQITGYLENDKNLEAYIEDIARDKLDFANVDEKIFYVIPAGS